jgi:hypothetical protein
MPRSFAPRALPLAAALLAATLVTMPAHAGDADGARLTGWARLPAATFSEGPTSGRFANPNPYGTNLPPYVDRQPVQGFSAVLPGPRRDTYRFMTDNGFGAKANSADALLRIYTVRVDFRTRYRGSGTVSPADWRTGRMRDSFDARTFVTLSDPERRIATTIQADLDNFYGDATKPPVDAVIRDHRLLTGADFDIESMRRDRDGNLWFGDEFGPFLLKTDPHGKVLRAPIPLPGVYAPEHPDVIAGTATANLGGSGGFEGMALNASGTRLYTLLEKTVAGDEAKTLRIDEFDLASEAYTGKRFVYRLDTQGTAIGDMTAVDDHRFVVIERNGSTATSVPPAPAPFKRLYLIDIAGVADGGEVAKTELLDLMNVPDPHDLDRDGSTTYTMPYVTIENVLVLDKRRLLVVNDNNFPYGGGRAAASDDTELIEVTLPRGALGKVKR